MRRPYPNYRPSGVEWLDRVPEHWDVKRLKLVSTINDDALSDSEDPLRPITYVDIGSVDSTSGITKTEEMVFEDAPSRARRLVENGDTIVSTVRTYLRAIAPIQYPPSEMVVSTGFAVLRPREIEPTFAYWTLAEKGLVDEIVARSVGVSYPAINASEIGVLPTPLPPAEDQRSIAAFLDRETAKIDSLVAKKRLLLERLAEYRTALITRTVTKGLPQAAAQAAGLNPSPRLKPSGVEWLGEIPEHWDAAPVRRWFTIVNGGTPTSGENSYWDGETVWLTPDDLGRNSAAWINESRRKITETGVRNSSARVSPEGSLILSTRAPIGHLAITAVPAATNQGCRTLVPHPETDSTYAYYSLMASRPLLQELGKGTTFMELTPTELGRFRMARPPLHEQQAIAEFLDERTERINSLGGRVEAAIERLGEYRTALVTAAVTGKIDVREHERVETGADRT